jgi:hypothetical protein
MIKDALLYTLAKNMILKEIQEILVLTDYIKKIKGDRNDKQRRVHSSH